VPRRIARLHCGELSKRWLRSKAAPIVAMSLFAATLLVVAREERDPPIASPGGADYSKGHINTSISSPPLRLPSHTAVPIATPETLSFTRLTPATVGATHPLAVVVPSASPSHSPTTHPMGSVAVSPLTSHRPLVMGWLNSWEAAHSLLMEPVVSVLRMATGLDVVLHDRNKSLDDVDVFLVTQFGSKDYIREMKAQHGNHSIFLWWGGEAVEDNYVDVVDVSLGQATEPVHYLCADALEAPNFIRMPYWMTIVVAARGDPLRCELDPRLYADTTEGGCPRLCARKDAFRGSMATSAHGAA
jgi:hypothetical protein